MKKTFILLALTILIGIAPFFIHHEGRYEGADGQAEAMITAISPEYEPWFSSLYEPPSGEIESLLFTLQGAIGAGVIGYILGCYQRKRRNLQNINENNEVSDI